mmetsp:Transcript_9350/g.14515  ORF Transcript_9350/g.14515 Transcript_9350/m.14515 type:complete len:140 (+) Transcript_9350:167-586(+)
MKWLASIGCDLFHINENGHGILHKAAQRGNLDLCKWIVHSIVSKCVNVSLRLVGPDKEVCTPSDLAGMEGHYELAQFIAKSEVELVRSLSQASEGLERDCPSWLFDHPLICEQTDNNWSWASGCGLSRMLHYYPRQRKV